MQSLYVEMSYNFFTKVVDASLSMDIEHIARMGVSPEQASTLTSLSHSDVIKLSRIYQLIDIEVDERLLQLAMKKASAGEMTYGDIADKDMTIKLLSCLSTAASDDADSNQLKSTLNISSETVQQLSRLNVVDTLTISRTGIIWYSITAKETKLAMALEFIEAENRERASLDELIKQDASWPMVNALTGMSRSVFQQMRKTLNAPKSLGGPPRRLTEEEEIKAWNVWKESAGKNDVERCLAVSKLLNDMALRNIWPTISEWLEMESVKRKTNTSF